MQSKTALWYDEYYRLEQTDLSPWHRWLLPDLKHTLPPGGKLVELGCGQGQLLRHLAAEGLDASTQVFGLEQSATAIEVVRRHLPSANLKVGDIYHLDYPSDFFDVCCLMETIEHLEDPVTALNGIYRTLKNGGYLYVSFPNFIHLPWLMVRILSDLLNKPSWIVRQPVDIIYTAPQVIRLVKRSKFIFCGGIGSNYGPPVIYRLEKDWMTKLLNDMGLWWMSFHPILRFRKVV